ncbi:hypothetical protein J6590_025490 [Homalodisca vitripennis]|nr:hypothetical protein J6590_025490 [Homalodisca vitripennis]
MKDKFLPRGNDSYMATRKKITADGLGAFCTTERGSDIPLATARVDNLLFTYTHFHFQMASGLHDKSIEQLMDIPSSSEDEEEGSESEEYYNASKLLFTSTKQNPPIDEDNNLPDLERPPTSNTVSVPVPENDIVLNEDDIDHNKSLLWQIFICHKP